MIVGQVFGKSMLIRYKLLGPLAKDLEIWLCRPIWGSLLASSRLTHAPLDVGNFWELFMG